MKRFEIRPIPAKEEQGHIEPVYHVTVDGQPVICLSDSEAKTLSALNYSQQRGHLLRSLDPDRLARFRKALEEN